MFIYIYICMSIYIYVCLYIYICVDINAIYIPIHPKADSLVLPGSTVQVAWRRRDPGPHCLKYLRSAPTADGFCQIESQLMG